MARNGFRRHSEALPTITRFHAEQLFILMGAGRGRWRIELEARDGVIQRWFRQEGPGGAQTSRASTRRSRQMPERSLSPPTRELAERLAERMGATVGRCRVELEARDGVVQRWWVHRIDWGGARDLERFDRPA